LMGGARDRTRRLGCCKAAQHEDGCCEPHVQTCSHFGRCWTRVHRGAAIFWIAFANGTSVRGGKI
jgi:hypothetical protein